MANLSVCLGPLRLRCFGATAKIVRDEMGMVPGDLLLSDASTGESVLVAAEHRDELAELFRTPEAVPE